MILHNGDENNHHETELSRINKTKLVKTPTEELTDEKRSKLNLIS